MSEIIIIPEKKGIKQICRRCRHEWVYTGNNPFVCSCPYCRTTVTISRKNRNKVDSLDFGRTGYLQQSSESGGNQ